MGYANQGTSMTPEQVSLLAAWTKAVALADEAKKVIEAEMDLRKQVFASFYPGTPEEGVNTLTLSGGWLLKGTHKLDRKVDEAGLSAVLMQLTAMGVAPEAIIKWWPQVRLSGYRRLTDEQRAVFDTALVIKPQAPGLVLLPPKPAKGS